MAAMILFVIPFLLVSTVLCPRTRLCLWQSAVCGSPLLYRLKLFTSQYKISVEIKCQLDARGFYCRSYCLLNMFWAPLCPSSGAQEYYTVFAACGISCCGFQVADLVWSLKTTARNTTGSNHCIIILSS